MTRFLQFPGVAGSFVSTDDENLLDCDSSWFAQGTGGLWTVGTPSTDQATGVSPQSLKVLAGATTDITPVTDAAGFGLKIFSVAGDTFDINSGTPVIVPAGAWTELTESGPDGTYTVSAVGSADYYIAEVMLGTDPTFVPSIRIVGNVDLRTKASANNWQGTSVIFTTRNQNFGYRMFHQVGTIFTQHGTGSASRQTQSLAFNFTDGVSTEIRYTFDVATGSAVYFQDSIEIDTVASISGAAGPSGLEIRVGVSSTFSSPFDGKIFWTEIRDGIDGPIVARFDAEDIPL